VNERAGQGQFLFHPAREPAGAPLPEGTQVAEFKQPVNGLFATLSGNAVDIRIKQQVFHDRQVRIQSEALAHIADPLFHRFGFAHGVAAGGPGVAR